LILTGVSDTIKWNWLKPGNYVDGTNTYSILPDTTGYYGAWAKSWHLMQCEIYSTNAVHVTIPPPLEVNQVGDTLVATPGYASYQWYESNIPIQGATSQRHVLTYDGNYTVEASFTNGCVETSGNFDSNFKVAPEQEEEQEEEEQEEEIVTYPNPATGVFTLVAKIPVEDRTAEICIMDMMGRQIFQKVVEAKEGRVEAEIDITGNVQRLSILKLKSKNSSKTISVLQQ
jgi:hypothetical protein